MGAGKTQTSSISPQPIWVSRVNRLPDHPFLQKPHHSPLSLLRETQQQMDHPLLLLPLKPMNRYRFQSLNPFNFLKIQ